MKLSKNERKEISGTIMLVVVIMFWLALLGGCSAQIYGIADLFFDILEGVGDK